MHPQAATPSTGPALASRGGAISQQGFLALANCSFRSNKGIDQDDNETSAVWISGDSATTRAVAAYCGFEDGDAIKLGSPDLAGFRCLATAATCWC